MPNFQKCHKCGIVYPSQYLTTISARTPNGKVILVKVCNACRAIIIKQQG